MRHSQKEQKQFSLFFPISDEYVAVQRLQAHVRTSGPEPYRSGAAVADNQFSVLTTSYGGFRRFGLNLEIRVHTAAHRLHPRPRAEPFSERDVHVSVHGLELQRPGGIPGIE